MVYEDRRPKQLEIKRKEHYDRVYPRQQQLMKRLMPLLNKSTIIEENTEPYSYSPKKLSKRISVKGKKELNKFSNKKTKQKTKTTKKISEIRPDVLWGLS